MRTTERDVWAAFDSWWDGRALAVIADQKTADGKTAGRRQEDKKDDDDTQGGE